MNRLLQSIFVALASSVNASQLSLMWNVLPVFTGEDYDTKIVNSNGTFAGQKRG